MVGHEAFARAMVYAKSGRVHDVEVDDEALVITGRVKGTYRDDYAVAVHLASSRSGAVSAYRSQCNCPIATDCKHAAAVLIVARHLAAAARLVERPEWEKTLDKLLAGSPTVLPADIAPLALEFGVERIPAFRGYAGRQDLRIRPARRGRSGTWVRSGISWDDLDFVARSYVPEHRELLLQFRAAAGASARYSLPRSAWLSLSTVSTGFWGLLDQAAQAGSDRDHRQAAARSHPDRGAGRRSAWMPGARRTGWSCARGSPWPATLLDLTAVGVLGEPTHGVFQREPGDGSGVEELVIARLESVLSRELRQLVVDVAPVRVPESDEERFLADFAPQLRQKVRAGLRRPLGRAARSGRTDAGTDGVVRARPPDTAGLDGAVRRRSAGPELSARRTARPARPARSASRGGRSARPCRCRTRRSRSSSPSATRCRPARPRTRCSTASAPGCSSSRSCRG